MASKSKSQSEASTQTAAKQPLLVLRDVRARYESAGRAAAVDGSRDTLSCPAFELFPGELVCVLGANGSGKTTLVRVMTGILATRAGEVSAFGESIRTIDRKQLARRLAVVGQNEEVGHDFSVRDVVMMGRAPHQDAWLREREEDRAIVAEAIVRCRLEHLAHRSCRTLSGGEQKRVQIARALAQRAEALLLDEPAAFLDVHEQIALYDLLAREVKERNLACLVVMHDLNVAAQYADRVVLVKDGELVAIGTVDDVMTYRKLRDVFDADLYCGENEITKTRFFLPMRGTSENSRSE